MVSALPEDQPLRRGQGRPKVLWYLLKKGLPDDPIGNVALQGDASGGQRGLRTCPDT
jgi:hypothetical protein